MRSIDRKEWLNQVGTCPFINFRSYKKFISRQVFQERLISLPRFINRLMLLFLFIWSEHTTIVYLRFFKVCDFLEIKCLHDYIAIIINMPF